MKKSLVALATLSALGSAFADVDVSGGIKLYGVLDQAVMQTTANYGASTSATSQTTNTVTGLFAANATSRFGVKGSRDLGEGMKGLFVVEIQLAPDQATQLPNKNRQTYVGLENPEAGAIHMGTVETTAYEVFGMDVNGRIEYKPQLWRTTKSSDTQDRANNAVKLISKDFSGFTAHLIQNSTESAYSNAGGFTSLGLKYKSDNLRAALVSDKIKNTAGKYAFGAHTDGVLSAPAASITYASASTTATLNRTIAAVSYDASFGTLNWIMANASTSGSGSVTTNTIGVRVPFEKWTLAASYGMGNITVTTATASTAMSDVTLGAYYNFDKSTSFYVLASKTTADISTYTLDSASTSFAMGARYNF